MRKVYYCDHCGRHRLTRQAIEKHEPRCVQNPDRSLVSANRTVRSAGRGVPPPGCQPHADLDWLRETVDGCPTCMLAVIVQAIPQEEKWDLGWIYSEEVERFRGAEQREETSVW